MIAPAYIVEQVLMELINVSVLLGFIWLIMTKETGGASADARVSTQQGSRTLWLTASAERVTRAGGKIHWVQRRLGIVIALCEILLFVDSSYVNNIYPIWANLLFANLGGAILVADGFFITYFSVETLFKLFRASGMQSRAPRRLWLAMLILSSITIMVAAAAAFVVGHQRVRRAQGIYLLW